MRFKTYAYFSDISKAEKEFEFNKNILRTYLVLWNLYSYEHDFNSSKYSF